MKRAKEEATISAPRSAPPRRVSARRASARAALAAIERVPIPEDAALETIVEWTWKRFGPRVKLATGFNPEGLVVIDAIARVAPQLRVFSIDTGRLHEETYKLMVTVRERYGTELEVYFPERNAIEKLVRERGPYSFRKSVAERMECCAIRKVEPLGRALENLGAWVTGVRREQSATRSRARIVEWDDANGLVKVNPLAHWSQREVMERIRERDIPTSPLLQRGYQSVGCAPCTRPTRRGEDPRAGRWWWEKCTAKECGLHR